MLKRVDTADGTGLIDQQLFSFSHVLEAGSRLVSIRTVTLGHELVIVSILPLAMVVFTVTREQIEIGVGIWIIRPQVLRTMSKSWVAARC